MTVRRSAIVTAALLAALLAPTGPAAGGPAEERPAEPRTRLGFAVDDCEGCKITLHQARGTLDADVVHVWSSSTRTVRDGRVTFFVARKRTEGMSVTVQAPWEGHTGYLTTVAWRYGGKSVGEAVTLAEAVTKKRASGCWAGTERRTITVPLVVEQVEVRGVHEMVPGSIAYAPTTQSWLRPMREVWGGVLGSQDVDICR